MHVMQEEGLADQLLAYRLEEPILRTMAKHPRLQVYEARFGQLYGDETRRSGLVDSRKMYDLLVTCLTQAESDLLYVRTTQNYDSPYSKSQNATSSGYNSGGGGKKDNKTNGKQINQTAGSKKQQGNGGNNSSGNSSSGSPKKPRRCSYCALPAASHGHVLECRKIENVPAEMMYKFCHQLSACTSCLLTNQYTDWNKRGAWFTTHEPSCNRDFVCRVGDCGSKSPMYQAHVVVCYEHHVENKARIDDFQKTSAAYANMQFYAFPSHLKETDSAANKQERRR